MRIIIQRVKQARVDTPAHPSSIIGQGLVVFVGITFGDTEEDIQWLCSKLLNLRIFTDAQGKMNLPIDAISGEVLAISQFTLHASTKKGNRPSYTRAAPAEIAIPLYKKFVSSLRDTLGDRLKTGVFGADMQVSLINDGPVTLIIDSKDRQ